VRGDKAYLVVHTDVSSGEGEGNNTATATYHYGYTHFAGVTIRLGADINMGAGNNYMPIGGQYLMTTNDNTTRIDASFNGVFDGQGHSITVYCDRWATVYGDGSSVGVIGRLGVHDNDLTTMRPTAPAVKNLVVYGSIKANRHVGGVVGKIGKTAYNNGNANGGAVIDRCVNYATVIGTDSKGTGGIVGAAWNGGAITNCYNRGNVSNTGAFLAGGIAGSAEITIENCYNTGTVTSGLASMAMALGTNNGGATIKNSYYLSGSAAGGGWYSGSRADNTGAKSSEEMKANAFVALLGDAYRKDPGGGYPILDFEGGTRVLSTIIPSTTTVTNGAAVTTVDNANVATVTAPSAYTLTVDAAGKTYSGVTIKLPQTSVGKISNSGSTLNIGTDLLNMFLPNAALQAIYQKGGTTLNISIEKNTDGEYAVSMNVDGMAITSLGGGTATISIPYTLKTGEVASGVKLYSVAADGTRTEITSRYSIVDGYVTFETGTLGKYVIGYVAQSKWNPFTDVKEGDWFYEYVKYVFENGLMTGTTTEGTTFEPETTMSRAMFVTVLYRMEGEPGVTAANKFPDVKSGEWYTDAVIWASERSIVLGYDTGLFGTGDNITREQMMTLMYRYARFKGFSTSATTSLTKFSDADTVSGYALDAIKWSVAAGVVQGREGPTIAPQISATRAEAATLLMRFIEYIAK
jgi:hypothetical protein